MYEEGPRKNVVGCARCVGPYTLSELQREAFSNFGGQIFQVCRVPVQEGWSRGRKILFQAIVSLSESKSVNVVDPAQSAAQRVDPGRLSLPAKAGVTKREDLFAPERARQLRE